MSRNKTPAERRHHARLAEMACAVCRRPGPSCVHHIREGQGMAQRAGHYLAVPLCYDCHQGPGGIHGDRSRWAVYRTDELQALDDTIRQVVR